MKIIFAVLLTLLLVCLSFEWALHAPVAVAHAQGGMSKATAKLLVTDLIEAGFAPQIREENGVFFIRVHAEPEQAGTAAQVQAFANARSVTARVLVVQFE